MARLSIAVFLLALLFCVLTTSGARTKGVSEFGAFPECIRKKICKTKFDDELIFG